MNIRDFPDALIRKAKMFGFERGMTLREVAIQAMEVLVGSEPRRAETSHRPGTGGSFDADEHKAAKGTQEALPANRGRVNSATQTYERPDSAEIPTDPKPAKKSRFSNLPVMGDR